MIFVWNVYSCCSTKFQRICRNLVQIHKPIIMVIIESWVSGNRALTIIKKLGFNFHICEEAFGFSRRGVGGCAHLGVVV